MPAKNLPMARTCAHAKKWGIERQKQAQDAVKRSSGWSLLLAIAFFFSFSLWPARSTRGNWHEPAGSLIAEVQQAVGWMRWLAAH